MDQNGRARPPARGSDFDVDLVSADTARGCETVAEHGEHVAVFR
jgi:hypothetical protein